VAIINFHHQFPLEGYRRLTFLMLDRDVVAVSPDPQNDSGPGGRKVMVNSTPTGENVNGSNFS
jgi:hypothetical protein